ncbi:uncharacterized protein LOC125720457 isoform X2 [Brienomyrus brachyistius]|uniref:uncharacterized protein LOC125720457 isoform X2 n=1 Tax=Brienomyrus brachyistius TaxID=42636 RepID=UPI0020B1CC8B|nr:uncharacterized protein LOC125720457 isoform X2 [Brienomyrus brachyistius]
MSFPGATEQDVADPVAGDPDETLDLQHSFQEERGPFPVASCMSMRTDSSMGPPVSFKQEAPTDSQMRRMRRCPETDAAWHISRLEDEVGLEVRYIDAFKGRGVFAVSAFEEGEFIVEYRGDLINFEEAQRRRRIYHDALKGFMIDFIWQGKCWTIDAALDDGSLGRLFNDDHLNPNCIIKRIIVGRQPHLCIFAMRDIIPGEELTYTYGDADCPWREKVSKGQIGVSCLPQSSGETPASAQHCVPTPWEGSIDGHQDGVLGNDSDDCSIVGNSEEESGANSSDDSVSGDSACGRGVSRGKRKGKRMYSETADSGEASKSEDAAHQSSSHILIKGISKTSRGSRVYDKKQYCFFCCRPLSKIARHLEQVHSNEPDVAKALTFPKGSKERKILLEHLRNKGNFAYNAEILEKGQGDLVPCKKPRKDSNSGDFIHCLHCLGLFAKKFLWRHMKQCKLRTNELSTPGTDKMFSPGACTGPTAHGASAGLHEILRNMNDDDLLLTIKDDPYIIKLGEYFYNKLGADSGKHAYVRLKMREVGRLLIQAKKATPLRRMEDFVDPSNFLHVVTAVKMVCGYDDEKCTFKRPTLAVKLGHSLQKIAFLVSFQAMMDRDNDKADKARDFNEMYTTRWCELLSANTLRTFREDKWNAPLVIPFTEDVKMMHLFLDNKQKNTFNDLSSNPTSKSWTCLAKVTLSQVILFNRRREGEVSKMPLTSFVCRNTFDLHEDIALALTELERKLCHHFTWVEIKGKRGRKVPVLLTPEMQRSLELLKEKREVCGVPSANIYMFARPSALSHLRGSDCLRDFAVECGAKNPKALLSTKHRKYVATLSNVLHLNNTETDRLADVLGHNIRVQREDCRLPGSTLQLAKISKVLMALETGRFGEFSGKNLEDINIDASELEAEVSIEHSLDRDENSSRHNPD